MNTDFLIRELRRGDYEQWKPLFLDYAKPWDKPITQQHLVRVWEFFTDPSYRTYGMVFTAGDGASIIGFAHYMLYPTTYNATMDCYLHDLYVVEAHRGCGIASRMLNELKKIGKQQKWGLVYWKTRPGNLDAQKLYNSVARSGDWLYYEMKL